MNGLDAQEERFACLATLEEAAADGVSFALGQPGTEELRETKDIILKATTEILSSNPDVDGIFKYGPDQGCENFRKELAKFLSQQYGDDISSSNLIVTAGATQGLHFALSILAENSAPVLVEDPTYFIALKIFQKDLNRTVVPGITSKTYPSADCYSDHVPMVGKFKFKLKKNSKLSANIKFDLAILKTNQTIGEKYQISVQNKFEALGDAEEVEQQLENFKSAIMEAATEVIPKVKRKAKQKWMTEEILNMMEERRWAKGNKEKFEQIHKKVQEKCNMSKENWVNEKCKEIEQQRKHAPQTMYRDIEEIT
ncbi:aspartate aminotransferase [Plakobranchus ocellatus]|uniref:Aspartate aminotransferase n=1 Tax=Plakobranchus ocellatus TaxID=259542 RepID=A0AAV3Z1C6_9GAST|nr:aspartate aminotransferase [Plakobranchus ocellatus]